MRSKDIKVKVGREDRATRAGLKKGMRDVFSSQPLEDRSM